MTRYWVSWWSDNPINAETPFQWWDTGHRVHPMGTSYVAVIDAESLAEVWLSVERSFPDYSPRFFIEKPADWRPPSDRFQ